LRNSAVELFGLNGIHRSRLAPIKCFYNARHAGVVLFEAAIGKGWGR
jgi:hypothetical protein